MERIRPKLRYKIVDKFTGEVLESGFRTKIAAKVFANQLKIGRYDNGLEIIGEVED